MNTSGFYKKNEDSNTLFYAPDFVDSTEYQLLRADKDTYQYPVGEWYWFETIQEATEYLLIDDSEWTVAKALIEIKKQRMKALDAVAISSGVSTIYAANYEAAIELLGGRPNTIMKNGVTATDYLANFGARLGMNATQFANYIVSENQRVGIYAASVEKRYLALTYAGDAANGIVPVSTLTNETDLEAAVIGFKTYCESLL